MSALPSRDLTPYDPHILTRELSMQDQLTKERARLQAAILTLRQVLAHLDHGHLDVARNDIRFFFRHH